MMGFFGMVGRGLRNVLRFSGRDTLSQFWPYTGAVIGASMVAGGILFVPMMATTMAKMQKFAAEHPDQADVVTGPGSYSISINGNHPELLPDFSGLMSGVLVITVIVVVLLAAAVTRRLHDRGRRGYWALFPLFFLMSGMAGMRIVFSQFGATGEPDMSLFGLMFLNNILYLASLALLLVQLVQDGTKGPNRYGDDPRA